MMNGQEKSEKRRKEAADAIAALGIPGVASTRNLEAWLIQKRREDASIMVFVYPAPGIGNMGHFDVYPALPVPQPAPVAEAEEP